MSRTQGGGERKKEVLLFVNWLPSFQVVVRLLGAPLVVLLLPFDHISCSVPTIDQKDKTLRLLRKPGNYSTIN